MTKKAFLIGANTLGLKYAEKDVKLMKEALIKYGYEVVSPPASKSAIMGQFDDLIDNVAKTDTVIFYFSGHGHTPKGELLLVVEDELQKAKSCIHIHSFIEALENCRAENKLMVLDCCKADAATKEWNPEQSERYRILTASERLERGKEIDQFQASFLTYYLHRALVSGFYALADRDGIIRVNILYEWLKSQAQRHNAVEHTPQVPIPNLLGNQKANFEVGVVEMAHKDLIPPSPNKLTVSDWGNVLDISNFYGRQQNFTDLEQGMKLCKKQRRQLLQVLGQAFTNLNDLNILCFQAFGIYAQHITTTDDEIPIILGKILQYAELHYRLFELIEEACVLRPNDLALHSIKKHYEPFLEEEIIDPYEALLLCGNRAMINRKVLREALRNFNNLSGKPVLIINGPQDSGKTYSKYLLYYLEAATHDFRTVTIDCEYLAAHSIDKIITAELVGQRIAAQLLLEDMPKREKEEEVRWVMKFCNWLMIKLRDISLPHWLILDHIYKVQFSEGAHDLIHSLITHIDENKLNMRLLLLGYLETARLRPGFSDIIAIEELQYMTPDDYFDFFYQLYELRKQSKRYNQKDFTEEDIVESIVHVASKFDQSGKHGKEALGDILMQEINRIFQQPASSSQTPEMKDRVMAIVQKRLAHGPADQVHIHQKRYNAYFEAAAVLSTFQSKTLKPVDGEENSDDLQDVIFESLPLSPAQELDSYTLLPQTRREVLLQLGSREALLHALEANPNRSQDVTQQMLEAYINGMAPPIQDHNVQHIAAAAQVITWLRDIIADLPDQDTIQQRQDFCNLIQPFYDLMGPYFRGRDSELQKLRKYIGVPSSDSGQGENDHNAVQSQQTLPILIYGVGGIGKSTLIARFIWEYATLPDPQRFPWAYINFDRPGLLAEEPVTLLIEAVRQLGIQYPHARVYCDRFCESMKKNLAQRNATMRTRLALAQYNDLIHGIPSTRTDWIPYIRDFASLLKNLQVEAKTFLFVLDTLEEVQYRSYVSVEELCHFLRIFQEYVPHLRVVLGSRVPLVDSLEFPAEKIQLENFDPMAAQGFLEAYGMPAKAAQAFVDMTGGNPLSLKLATEVWRLEKNNPHSPQMRIMLSSEAEIQSMLYTRILDHIHNADVRKLAHPGLVLRRITPDIISKVLAPVCHITIQSQDDAQKLFDEMQREVSLVTLENGALRHRSDVRRVMLRLIRAKEPEKVRRIEDAAIEYYSQFTDPESRAEEIYHRLSQNQSRTFLETRWQDSTGIEVYLYSALDELSVRSKTWLAIHLNIALTSAERKQAELADWEHDTEKVVRRLLQRNDPEQAAQALKLLHERNERIANSHLYQLEAQVFEHLQEWEQALTVLKEGINNITTDHMLSIDLRLHSARLYIRQQNVAQAQSSLHEVAMLISAFGPDTLREIDLALLSLELQRATEHDIGTLEQENPLQASLRKLFTQLTNEQIAQHSLLMARFACAMGEEYPECLLPIIRNNYLFSRRHLPLRHLCRALVDWDIEASRGRGESPGTLARWIGLPEQSTLSETWQQTIFPSTPEALTTLMMRLLETIGNPPQEVCTAMVSLICEQAQDLTTPQNMTTEGGIEKPVETGVELPAPLAPAYEANRLSIKLTNQQKAALVEAFLSAFPTVARIEQMVRFRLNRRLETIALSGTLADTVYQLIQAADAEGWILDLVAAAIESNPHNAHLRQAANVFNLLPSNQPTLSQAIKARASQFEAKSVLNPTQFSARLGELEAQIGRLELASNTALHVGGTGFLIGSNIFMTTYHNITKLQHDRNISLRFDYKVSLDGRSITNGTLYQIASKDWLIDYDEQLDYAILRVSGTPGLDPIGGERAELGAPPRGWITIPVTLPALSPGTPIVVLHYSKDSPLQMSFEISGITDISEDRTHIRYQHNTEPGSSGAPCFNSNWELIAIHQRENSNGYSEGTTILALKSLLETRGILSMQQAVTQSAEFSAKSLPDTSELYAAQQGKNDLPILPKQIANVKEACNRVKEIYNRLRKNDHIHSDEIHHLYTLLEDIRTSVITANELRLPYTSFLPLLAIQEQIKRAVELSYALSQNLRSFETSPQAKSSRLQYELIAELRELMTRLLDQLQDLERLLES